MDSSRNSLNPARRCAIGFHGRCNGCDTQLTARGRHAHIHHSNKSPEQLCSKCLDLTVAAAQIILGSVEDFGISGFTAQDLIQMARDGRILIALQLEFDLGGRIQDS